jgi:hypothetical protein
MLTSVHINLESECSSGNIKRAGYFGKSGSFNFEKGII